MRPLARRRTQPCPPWPRPPLLCWRFQVGVASVLFINITQANGTNLSMDVNLTTVNRVHVNSSRSFGLNVSANISIFGLSMLRGKAVQVDYTDNDSFSNCSSPVCVNLSFSDGVFIFNVSSFTSYRIIDTCGLINESANVIL